MSDFTKEDLKETLEAILEPRRASLDPKKHEADHAFIDILRDRYKKRAELWQKFRLSIVGTAATTAIGFLVYIGTVVVNAIKHAH